MDEKEQDLVCQECGKTFTFSQADASYFQKRGWPMPPTSCRGCRTRAKHPAAARTQPDVSESYATGDPNEYRSPMDCAYPTAPRVRDMRPTRTAVEGEAEVDDDVWARDPNAVGDPNEYRSPMQGGEPMRAGGGRRRFGRRPDRGDEARAHAYRRQVFGDTSEYRSPMGGQIVSGPAPTGRRDGASARPLDDAPRGNGERRGRQRRPRPMYDVVCAKCGNAAQVPFEPTEGRDVLCGPCFAEQRAAAGASRADGDA